MVANGEAPGFLEDARGGAFPTPSDRMSAFFFGGGKAGLDCGLRM
jgi:hypothetical protein